MCISISNINYRLHLHFWRVFLKNKYKTMSITMIVYYMLHRKYPYCSWLLLLLYWITRRIFSIIYIEISFEKNKKKSESKSKIYSVYTCMKNKWKGIEAFIFNLWCTVNLLILTFEEILTMIKRKKNKN